MFRFVFLALFFIYTSTDGCEILTETQHGCKIENSQCVCGFGCKSEYRYTTKKECTDLLKGRVNDMCGRQPCLNGGSCTQTSLSPGYKCGCEGTKFYGNRCQRACPKDFSGGRPIPHECIEI